MPKYGLVMSFSGQLSAYFVYVLLKGEQLMVPYLIGVFSRENNHWPRRRVNLEGITMLLAIMVKKHPQGNPNHLGELAFFNPS